MAASPRRSTSRIRGRRTVKCNCGFIHNHVTPAITDATYRRYLFADAAALVVDRAAVPARQSGRRVSPVIWENKALVGLRRCRHVPPSDRPALDRVLCRPTLWCFPGSQLPSRTPQCGSNAAWIQRKPHCQPTPTAISCDAAGPGAVIPGSPPPPQAPRLVGSSVRKVRRGMTSVRTSYFLDTPARSLTRRSSAKSRLAMVTSTAIAPTALRHRLDNYGSGPAPTRC
jgi:hypothetical protein